MMHNKKNMLREKEITTLQCSFISGGGGVAGGGDRGGDPQSISIQSAVILTGSTATNFVPHDSEAL
ncbi:hypothetical protein ACSLBF_14625 [Pseudoalteromonas sp. T1lg65]|uniref:hypothetical protein n=1 Tax=Pseudoalteromonas sp. T1lg65 TaxID=2077101 RepID=UPI003F7AB11A